MVKNSDKRWFTRVGNRNQPQYSSLENPINSIKRQKDTTPKDERHRSEGVQHATGAEQTAIMNSSRKNEAAGPKRKLHPVVDVSSKVWCESKVWCSKEQYCTGTWSVRSMHQGKLNMVKQEMARLNIDILGISELKWTKMGKFNSDDHYIYYCGQESLRGNEVALIVNKRVWNAVLGSNIKNDRMI